MKNSIEELVAAWRKKFSRIPLDLPKARGAAIRDLFKEIEIFKVSKPNNDFDVLIEQVEVSIALCKDFPNEEEVWIQMLYQISVNFSYEDVSDHEYYSAFEKTLTLMKEIQFKGYSGGLSANLRKMIERFLKEAVIKFSPCDEVSMSLAETICEYRLYDLFFKQHYVKLEGRWVGSEPVLIALQNQIDRMRGEEDTQEWVESAIYDYSNRIVAQAWLTHTTARDFRERNKLSK